MDMGFAVPTRAKNNISRGLFMLGDIPTNLELQASEADNFSWIWCMRMCIDYFVRL